MNVELETKFKTDIRKIIGKNIKKFRKEKGISVMQLSEILNITPEYLKRIEAPNDPRKNCSLMLLYKLSLILEHSMDDFIKE